MSKLAKIVLGITVILVFIAVTGFIVEHLKRSSQVHTSSLCPVSNSTTSFCIVKDGKPYYFAIEGWIEPNSTIMERYLTLFKYGLKYRYYYYARGLVLFLKVRTNLDWEHYISEVECGVGELYKRCFVGSISNAVKINDTYLVPYVLEELEFWELFKIVKDYHMNASDVRLRFTMHNFLGLKPDEFIEIGRIFLAGSRYHDDEIDIYVMYPRPEFSIVVKDIKYLGKYESYYHVLNASLELRNVGMAVYYTFDEFGHKAGIHEEFVPLYILSIKWCPSRDMYVVEILNEMHCMVAIPISDPLDPDILNGGGFKDVWKEPQHEYIGSYASSGDTIWLSMRIGHGYIVNSTAIFITPWGQVLKIRIPSE